MKSPLDRPPAASRPRPRRAVIARAPEGRHRAARGDCGEPQAARGPVREERHRLTRSGWRRVLPTVPERRRCESPVRQRTAAKVRRDQSCCPRRASAGCGASRCSRRRNVLPPVDFVQQEVTDHPGVSRGRRAAELLHLQARLLHVHHFYDQLCPPCADLNLRKRTEPADLAGRVALLTGGRVKIGYQAGIKLLRAGAQLIVTTRFPRDRRRNCAARI